MMGGVQICHFFRNPTDSDRFTWCGGGDAPPTEAGFGWPVASAPILDDAPEGGPPARLSFANVLSTRHDAYSLLSWRGVDHYFGAAVQGCGDPATGSRA